MINKIITSALSLVILGAAVPAFAATPVEGVGTTTRMHAASTSMPMNKMGMASTSMKMHARADMSGTASTSMAMHPMTKKHMKKVMVKKAVKNVKKAKKVETMSATSTPVIR